MTATVVILIVEMVCEIIDATLLLKAQKGQHLWGFSLLKLQRPWCTMIFGTATWLAMIAIGVLRGKDEALPVNTRMVEIGGLVGGSCKINLYGNALRGAIIAWSDGAFQAWGSTYDGAGLLQFTYKTSQTHICRANVRAMSMQTSISLS